MRIALAQFTARPGDVAGNLARMRTLLADAARDRPDLVCFPELGLPGYLLDPARYTGAFVAECAAAAEELEQAARGLRVRIAYGTAERHGGALRNLIVITEPGRPGAGGRTIYAKTHMVRAERAVFTPGTDLVLTEDGRLGLGCCYDLAFPGVCARLAEAGARALIFPMAWEKQRAFVFEGVVAARAIENVAYVVCANQAGTMGLTRFHGGSRIIDPLGRTRLAMGDTVGVAAADLNLDWVSRLRSSADTATYPLLDDRQPPMPVRRGSTR